MKQQITRYERDILDSMVVALDQIEQARRAQVESIHRVLMIDDWDRDKLGAVSEFVAENGGCIDKFLDRLGVLVADPVTD
jgi:hypothetical protein